jgi:membrane protein
VKPNKLTFGFIFGLLKQTVNEWMEDNALRLSAALAYYSIFSIAPLLVIAIGAAGQILGAEAAQKGLSDELQKVIGQQSAEAVQSMIQSASKPSSGIIATVVGFVVLLFGASGVFGQLKDALNTIWEVKVKAGLGVKGFLRERLLSFGMVVVIGFLLLVSLMLTSMLGVVSKNFSHVLPMAPAIWAILTFLISFVTVSLLFAAIFKLLPDVELEWRDVWIGAVFTAFLFEVGKFGLGWYLGRESTASSYGAAASVVLLLLWVYYASLILLFGAEFTQVYTRSTGSKVTTKPTAEPVTNEQRAQEGMASGGDSGAKPQPEKIYEPVIVPVIHPTPETSFPTSIREVPSYLVNDPVAATLTAVGAGFLFGMLSRAT